MAKTPDLSAVPLRLSKPVYRYHQYQGFTNDCGPTSVAIAVNALLGERKLEGPTVAEEMSRVAFEWKPVPHLVVQRIRNWATFPWGMAYRLWKEGFRARWRPFGTLEKLEQNLRADRLTLVVMGEPWRWEKWKYVGWAHVKVLFGRALDGRLLFVDPGYARPLDSGTLECHGLFAQDEDEFLRQWRNLLRIYVEVEQDVHS